MGLCGGNGTCPAFLCQTVPARLGRLPVNYILLVYISVVREFTAFLFCSFLLL